MAELSKHVPIIPVIMKADTMTIHEAQRFRQEVVNRLQNPSEHACCCCCIAAAADLRGCSA
jgi:septin family protein